MSDLPTHLLAQRVIELATANQKILSTAESCTGGLISAALTDVSGSSAVFTHGLVTYANEAKEQLLGVPHEILMTHGAVSAPVAAAMAFGARQLSHADVAISVTGIAGPGGGTPEKPVGLVYIGVSTRAKTMSHRHRFSAQSRRAIRTQTVKAALRYFIMSLQ